MTERSLPTRIRTGLINQLFRQANSLTVFCGSLVLGLMLAGCQQQPLNEESTEKSSSSELSETESETANNDLLDEGFYSSESTAEEKLEQVVQDVEPSDMSGSKNQSSPVQDAIVAGSEFSSVAESLIAEPAVQEPYCLNLDRSEISTGNITPEKACEQISNRLASVSYAGCASAKLKHSQCHSVSGFPILFSEFPPIAKKVPQGRILVIGGTHGDELTSVSIAFKWIEKLNKFHSGLFHWHVAPMMNPDGVLNSSATRTNKNGVDLNRNMPSDDWEENALKYWNNKQQKNPRRYPGEKPASEPETQWLIDEINTFKPDAIISVHAPYGVVDFDALVLNTAPKSLGKLTLNLLGTYPGSLGNYAGINRNIPVITLELPHAWVMPSDEETTKIWEDIVSWLRKNVGTKQLADANDQTTTE